MADKTLQLKNNITTEVEGVTASAGGIVSLPLSTTFTLTIGLRAGGSFDVRATT